MFVADGAISRVTAGYRPGRILSRTADLAPQNFLITSSRLYKQNAEMFLQLRIEDLELLTEDNRAVS